MALRLPIFVADSEGDIELRFVSATRSQSFPRGIIPHLIAAACQLFLNTADAADSFTRLIGVGST
jgi:hypothetical protein